MRKYQSLETEMRRKFGGAYNKFRQLNEFAKKNQRFVNFVSMTWKTELHYHIF